MQSERKKRIFIGIITAFIIFTFIGGYYLYKNRTSSKIIFPLLIQELRFQSDDICQKQEQHILEDLKWTVQQIQEFDQAYQSDFLEKASILIQSLQLLQQYETGSQGDANLFQLHTKNLRQCSNSTSGEKLELKELKNQIIQKQGEYTNEKNFKINQEETKKDELAKVRQLIKISESNYTTVTYEQEQKIQQKERLRRSYKNETELATYMSQLERQIEQQKSEINKQQQYISNLNEQMEQKQNKFDEFESVFQGFKSQLQDSKALEQVFTQFYLKEDLPVVQVLKDYHVHLQKRYENIQTLVGMEPDPIQKRINIQMQDDIKIKIDVFIELLNKMNQQKLDSQNGVSIFDTPFENMTLIKLKQEIKTNDQQYTKLLTQRSKLEIDLLRHQELLESELQRLKHEEFKLSKHIEERKTLDQDKDQQKEIQKITDRIIQLETEKLDFQNQLELLKQREQDLVQDLNGIEVQMQTITSSYQNYELELNKEYHIREEQLKISLRDCIKEKKLYEHYKQNQEQNVKKITEIRDQIPEQVQILRTLLQQYSQQYTVLNQSIVLPQKNDL